MTPTTHLHELFDAQRVAFEAEPMPDADIRCRRLGSLRSQLQRWQDKLAEAINKDFSYRPTLETKMLDLLGAVLDIEHTLAHVRKWMKPQRRRPDLLFAGNSLRVWYQPKGVVGVIVPWNFPVYLAIGPLAAALAAGNRVMIKMSESTPATNAVMRDMLAEIYEPSLVTVIGEELDDPSLFTALPFNHIIFTGSANVGRMVMGAAAKNLTPVTLELGGKSPALLTRHFDINEAARCIAHGKWSNAGQICVAPDYVLVPTEHETAFVEAVKRTFTQFSTGSKNDSPGRASIINERQWQRLQGLLEDARAKGAKIEACPPESASTPASSEIQRQMPLYIITQARLDMKVMQEELFGPILPVLPYDTIDRALSLINSLPRPLALYCFTTDAAERDDVLRRTLSGGVTINDWCWHVVNHDAPFGGIGGSGMGSYHGIEGFRELSHARTVFEMRRWFPIGLFRPPYGRWAQQLVLRWKLGQADPRVGQGTSQWGQGQKHV
jgi:coniferyl-aldehyde dehydrogenase